MSKTKILLGLSTTLFLIPASLSAGEDICVKTAHMQRRSAAFELKEEFVANKAVCINLTDDEEREECMAEVLASYKEDRQLVMDQYQARLELCDKLGGGAYDPEIDPDDFTTVIDNPYLPFPVGASWTYESETDEGLETIVVTVLEETREILGVECVSVQDIVYLEGEPIEDTIDWFAQDADGNVWYFGEISFNFEDGYVADIEGSWLSGEDGAKPGIVMLGDLVVDTTYRQEWLLGDAEDAGTLLATGLSVETPIGTFEGCIQTEDFLPPEPDALEYKFYAPGIGFIRETKPGEDETVELIGYSGL